MKNLLDAWQIAFLFYVIVGAILFLRFTKKADAIKGEYDHSAEAVVMIILWPICYPIWMHRLHQSKKTPKGE